MDDLEAGRDLRDVGAAAAGINSPLAEHWRSRATDWLLVLAGWEDHVFSSDDLVEIVGTPPVPNMLGALFLGARRAGLIDPVGYTQSTRPAAHARTIRTWKGRRHDEQTQRTTQLQLPGTDPSA